jgi:hypothetical protein
LSGKVKSLWSTYNNETNQIFPKGTFETEHQATTLIFSSAACSFQVSGNQRWDIISPNPRSQIGYCKLELHFRGQKKPHTINQEALFIQCYVPKSNARCVEWKSASFELETHIGIHPQIHTHTPTQQKTFRSLFVPTLGEATTTTTYSPTKTSFNLQMCVCMGTILFLASTIHKSRDPLKWVVGSSEI